MKDVPSCMTPFFFNYHQAWIWLACARLHLGLDCLASRGQHSLVFVGSSSKNNRILSHEETAACHYFPQKRDSAGLLITLQPWNLYPRTDSSWRTVGFWNLRSHLAQCQMDEEGEETGKMWLLGRTGQTENWNWGFYLQSSWLIQETRDGDILGRSTEALRRVKAAVSLAEENSSEQLSGQQRRTSEHSCSDRVHPGVTKACFLLNSCGIWLKLKHKTELAWSR